MGINLNYYKLLVIGLGLFFAPLAQAQVPPLEPLNHETRYDVTWNGIKLGRIRITINETPLTYHIVFDLETHALEPLMRAERTVAVAEGTVRDGQYIAKRYTSRGDKQPTTTITYDEAGHIATYDRAPLDDPKWRPVVPRDEANAAVDPITAFFNMRKAVHDGMAVNKRDVSLRTYEGARLAEMDFKVISPANEKIMGKDAQAINIVASRKLINGYTLKEKKKYEKGDPVVHLYFSADGQFVPLKIEMEVFAGMLTATLVEIK